METVYIETTPGTAGTWPTPMCSGDLGKKQRSGAGRCPMFAPRWN